MRFLREKKDIVTNLYITVTLVLPISYCRLSKKDEGPYMNTVHTNYINTTINGPEGKISVKHNLFINSLWHVTEIITYNSLHDQNENTFHSNLILNALILTGLLQYPLCKS